MLSARQTRWAGQLPQGRTDREGVGGAVTLLFSRGRKEGSERPHKAGRACCCGQGGGLRDSAPSIKHSSLSLSPGACGLLPSHPEICVLSTELNLSFLI